ncbi:MAG: hypothetical protein COT34_01425 [Candidatus Nealsonbacteria bacterium CG08_land_8_20_14_0_20_43_11]|uniref:PilN domain-containing protein n=1 Tax=Candidatus Nealsonbacteria bacterium CG08_land_8_20_14_0_20_43_11 TaxID=1974706 RepID=A0A2M6T0Z9_9BACT|nr:MAG: hypothetical protein COT34_01425 [Candidatus Nealsonbacteria bacterium CG08_land_8_20_14_0_20_43_11]
MINLLPPSEKELLVQDEKRKPIIIFGFLISAFFVFLSLILFAINVEVETNLEAQKVVFQMEEERLNTQQVTDLKRKISSANKELLVLDSFYQKKVNLVDVIEKISQLLPPNVSLTNFSYQETGFKMTLSGFALTREELVEFKEKLEKEGSFQEISFPASNWVKPREIKFNLTLKLKNEN